MMQTSTIRERFSWLRVREAGSFWRLTGVLFLVFLSGGLWSPLMSVYVQSLGATTRNIGIVLGTYQATSLLTQYWWGRRSDRIGRRKPLLLFGLGTLGLSFLLTASAQQWYWLFATRLLEGFAFAAYGIGSLALMGDLLEDQASRGRLMGLYRTFGSLAFALAAFGGGILADRFSIRVPLFIAAVCYGLAFFLSIGVKEHGAATPPAEPAAQETKPVATLPTDSNARRALWPFLGTTFIWAFGMGAVVMLWPVYMQSRGYSKTGVGGLWGLAAAGEVVCFMIAGYLADRWGRKRVMITGVSCMACVYLAYTISTALPWLIVVQMVRSFSYASYEAPALLYATELGLRQQRGRLAGLYYSATALGGITGSIIGGQIGGVVGLATMYRGVVCIMLVWAFIVWWTMPRQHRVENEPGEPERTAKTPRTPRTAGSKGF